MRMNSPNVLVALHASGKRSRVWRIANQVAEFQRAKIHVIKLTRPGTANAVGDYPAPEPPANQTSWPDVVADDEEATVVPQNAALEPIVKTADAISADLVIVGADRRRGLHRLLPSTTHRVCDAINCHMLAVRSDGSADGYRRIGIAMDPSRSPMKVTQTGLSFANIATKVKVVIVTPMPLRTVPNLENLSGLHWSSLEDTVRFKRQIRSDGAEALRNAGLHPRIMEVRAGDTFHEIVACAKEMRADLMILSLSKRHARNHRLSRSMIRRLLNRLPCDVLVCRDE